MSMWDWNEVDCEVLRSPTPPAPVQLGLDILPKIPIPGTWEAPAIKRIGLPCVPLEEYDIHEDIVGIFAFLRSSGSTHGYVASEYNSEGNQTYRRFELTEQVAKQIKRDRAIDFAMAFVDDTMHCVIVTWWSDYALLGMRADLFEEYLRLHPLDLGRDLRDDLAEQLPTVDNLAEAQRWALKRREMMGRAK